MVVVAPAQSLEGSTGLLNLFGDATRLRLLALLADEELSVAELVKVTGLSQSRVSTHLGRLFKAGLLRDRKVGSSTFYRVHPAMPAAAAELWATLRPTLDDPALREDASRRDALIQARDEGSWPASIAGEMERHYSPGRTWQAMVHGVAALLDLGDVLDVGCGDGWSASLLAPRSRSYVGVDRSERVIEAADRRAGSVSCQSGEAPRFRQADMEQLPFAEGAFDTVLLFHVLPHAEEPARAIAEAARVLRPGGRLAITTVAAHDHPDRTAAFGHRHPGFAPAALEQLLAGAALEPLQCAITSRERKKPHFEVVTALAIKTGAHGETTS